jgi:hypothetical protein
LPQFEPARIRSFGIARHLAEAGNRSTDPRDSGGCLAEIEAGANGLIELTDVLLYGAKIAADAGFTRSSLSI